MSGRDLAKQEGKDWNKMTAKEKHRTDEQAHVKTLVGRHGRKAKAKKEAIASHPALSGGNGPTRHTLMLRAKDKGIKNFRVMNKEELVRVLAPKVTQAEILVVIAGAVNRWKAGWKK